MKKGKLNLYTLIHTESKYNAGRLFSGRVNSVLTKRGHEQAREFAKKLKNKKINIAYISPLRRTRQTLDHILKYHPGTKVLVDKRIIERDYGKLSRKSKVKYRKEHPNLYPIYHRSYKTPPPAGESMIQVEERVLTFLKEVIAKMKKERINVLIVAHSNSIRPIIRYFEGLTVNEMMKIEDHKLKIFNYKV